jgi:RNA polymerase sigma-70 factor (ECF subfamily)
MNNFKSARAGPMAFLYRRYAGRVYSLSWRLLGDVAAAEKATTAVFVILARHLDHLTELTNLEDWLKHITVDVALRYFREGARRSQALREIESADERVKPRMPLDKLSLDAPALEAAIRKLPVDSRFVFVLHDIEGFSHEKIAAMLGWTIGSVKAAVAKSRLELRQLLSNRSRDARSLVGECPRRSRSG